MIINEVCGAGCVCVYNASVHLCVPLHECTQRSEEGVDIPLLSLSVHSLEAESLPEYEACVLDFG